MLLPSSCLPTPALNSQPKDAQSPSLPEKVPVVPRGSCQRSWAEVGVQHCREQAEFTAQFQPSSRFTGGWRQTAWKKQKGAMSPKPFIFSSQGAAGFRAWRGAAFPGFVTGLRGKNEENTFLLHSQAVSFFYRALQESPNREHLTITMAEQAVLLCKNRMNFVLHIHSAFLDKCHQGHS